MRGALQMSSTRSSDLETGKAGESGKKGAARIVLHRPLCIYIVTMTLCVTLFYAFLSISSTHYHPTIGAEYNISLLAGGMKLAICGISLLLLFLIHYVNRFMLRKKQKEFAVEATLGMEQKTIGLLFFGETFFLLIFSVSVGILLGMVVSQVITAMLLASFGEPYAFSWSFFPDTVLLTVGFFVVCQIRNRRLNGLSRYGRRMLRQD